MQTRVVERRVARGVIVVVDVIIRSTGTRAWVGITIITWCALEIHFVGVAATVDIDWIRL